MEDLFFELLQVAIGNRTELSRTLSDTEWKSVYEMAKRQALIGICFVGCQRLPSMQRPPEVLWLQWLGMAVKIQQRNQMMNEEVVSVCKLLNHDGIRCCVLKGQGNLVNYPEGLREARTPGDIDLWVTPYEDVEIEVCDLDGKGSHYTHYTGKRGIVEYALMQGRILGKDVYDSIDYHHAELPTESGIEVELHYRPSFMTSPLRNWRMQRWFRNVGVERCVEGLGKMPVPTNSFNAVYQLAHINSHLFKEGIGLRQLLDYYFVLRALHVEQGEFSDRTASMAQWAEGMGLSVAPNVEIMHLLRKFGLAKFSSAVMYVLQKVFAMPSEYLLCPVDEKEGHFLLEEIMRSGNFGRYDDRNKELIKKSGLARSVAMVKHSMRLVWHYPEETLCAPFKVYRYLWRKLRLWRFE